MFSRIMLINLMISVVNYKWSDYYECLLVDSVTDE